MTNEKTNPNFRPTRAELVQLPLAHVDPSDANPRLNLEKEPLAELKKSIALNGLIQAIVARPKDDRYEIISGHRRYVAISELAREHPDDERFKRIACSVRNVDDAQARALRLAENVNRA